MSKEKSNKKKTALQQLNIWRDDQARRAEENMAIDEYLLKNETEQPLLRFYSWLHPSASFGYFNSYKETENLFKNQNLSLVRRWTGGGIVDHRHDLTYSLFLPFLHPLARLRGNTSYEIIHQAVATAYQKCGIQATLTSNDSKNSSPACFEKSVTWDVLNQKKEKLAGAGQKRTKYGLLHQGSVQQVQEKEQWKNALIESLTSEAKLHTPKIKPANITELMQKKYANEQWLKKR